MATPSQSYTKGVAFTLKARSSMTEDPQIISRTGFTFSKWTDGTTEYADQASVTFTAEVTNLSAEWTRNSYAVNFTATQTEGNITVATSSGSQITSGTAVAYETAMTVSVNANEGYTLQDIFVNGTSIKSSGTGGTYSFTVPASSVTITTTWNDVQGTVFFYPGY